VRRSLVRNTPLALFSAASTHATPAAILDNARARSRCTSARAASPVIQRLTRFTRPINYLGLPSLSIPTGFTKSGLPVGMQLVGRSFDEAMILRIGAAFQRATDFHDRVPGPA